MLVALTFQGFSWCDPWIDQVGRQTNHTGKSFKVIQQTGVREAVKNIFT